MEKDSSLTSTVSRQINLDNLTFQPKSVEPSLAQFLSTSHCKVCFKFHPNKSNRQWMHPEDGLDMLICYGCGVTVHKYCYGLKTPVDQFNVSGHKISMFVCEKCQYLGPQCSKECVVCYQEGGALKKVSNNTFIHVLCALFSNDYKVIDFQEMKITKNFELDSPLACDTPKVPCEYCQKPGANNINCKHPNCNKSAHLYCAWLHKISHLEKDEESTKGWRFSLRKESNYYGVSLQALEKDVHKRIIKIYERLLGVANKWNKSSATLFHNHKESQELQSSSSIFNKLQKSAKKPSLKDIKEIFTNLKVEMKNLVNLFPKAEDVSLLSGETIEAECQDHRIQEPLCICNSPYDSSQFMFACDSCENWFHCSCLNLSKKDIDKRKKFFCQRCQDWASIRSHFFNDNEAATNQLCKTKDMNRIIPYHTRDFWISDYIIISIMLQEKINQILADTSNFEVNYRNLLETAQFIPFKLSPLLTKLLENYSISYAINDILLKYFPIQDKSDSLVDQQNSQITHQKLRLEIECFQKIIEIYKEEELPNTAAISNINFIIDAKKWKLDFLQILETSGKDLTTQISDSNPFVIKNKEGSKIKFFLTLIHDNPPFSAALEGLNQLAYELKETITKKPTANDIQIFITKGKNANFGVQQEVKALETDVVRTINILKQYMKPSPTLAQIEQILIEAETSVFQVQGPLVSVIEKYKVLMTLLLKLSYYSSMFLGDETWENKKNLWVSNKQQLDDLFKQFEKYGASLGNESLVIKNKLMMFKQEIELNQMQIENDPILPFDFLEFTQEDQNSRDFSKYIRSKSTEATLLLDGPVLKWFDKLSKFYTSFVDQEVLQFNFENEIYLTQTQIKTMMSKFSIQNIQTQNQVALHLQEFKAIIQESVYLSHQDTGLSTILQSHQRFYLSLQLDLLEKGRNLLTIPDLSLLENLATNLSETSHKIVKICQDCQKFTLDYTNQILSCELKVKFLINKPNCEPEENEIKSALNSLLERSKNIPLQDILDKQKKLQKLLSLLKWKSDASNLLSPSQRTKKHSYKILKTLVSESKYLQIPADTKLCKDLQNLYQQVKENRQMSKDQIMILDKIKKEISDLENIDNISETRTAANVHKAKLTLSSALQVQKAYKACTFAILSEKDILESENVIHAYLKFREEVQSFVQQIDSLNLENFSFILSNLKNIKNQIMTLVLKDEETEELISLFEKKLQAKVLLNKKIFGSLAEINRSPEEWERVSKSLEKPGLQDLLDNMKIQLDFYHVLKTQILTIKERQGFLSMVQDASGMDLRRIRGDLVTQAYLQNLTERLDKCPVENKDLVEFIQQLNAEVDLVREVCKRLDSNKELQSEEIRPIMADIPALIDFLNKIPVNLDEEQSFLESYLEYLQALEAETLVNPELVPEPDELIEEPNNPQMISDQIRDESLYTTPKKSLTIMGFLEDSQHKEPIMQTHEGESTASQSDDNNSIEIQTWKQKVLDLKNLQNNKTIIKFLSIKELLLEGYELLYAHENIQALIETIKFMEHLTKEIEKHVRKTSKLSRNRLSETVVIDPLWHGFVDLRDELSAFHIATSFGIDYKSIVRNFGAKNKREILSIIKKEKGFLGSEAPKIVQNQPELLSKSSPRPPLDNDEEEQALENQLNNKVFINEQRTVLPIHQDEEDHKSAAEGLVDEKQVKVVRERKKKEIRSQTRMEITKILNNNKDLHKKRETKKILVTGLENRLHEMVSKSKNEYKKIREYLYSFLFLTHKNKDLTSNQNSQITLNNYWALFDNYVRSNLEFSKDLETNESSPSSPNQNFDSSAQISSPIQNVENEEIPLQYESVAPIENIDHQEQEQEQEQEEQEAQGSSLPCLENNSDQYDKTFFEHSKIPANNYLNSTIQTQEHTQLGCSPQSSLSTPNPLNSVPASFINSPSCNQGPDFSSSASIRNLNNTPYDENSNSQSFSINPQDKVYQFLASLSEEEKAKAIQFLTLQNNQIQQQSVSTNYQYPPPQESNLNINMNMNMMMNQNYHMKNLTQSGLQYPQANNNNTFAFNLAPPPVHQFSHINRSFNKNYINNVQQQQQQQQVPETGNTAQYNQEIPSNQQSQNNGNQEMIYYPCVEYAMVPVVVFNQRFPPWTG